MSDNYSLHKISKLAFHSSVSLPGVYIYWDAKRLPIYVGKAINLRNRLTSYLSISLEPKTKKLMTEAVYFSVTLVSTELEALLLEARLVNKFKPKYNIQLKDDKHPLYIIITGGRYPIIKTVRKIEIEHKNSACYGPFPSSAIVKYVLKYVRSVINYSDHLPQRKPCIYNQIGLCNPCPSTIENEKETSKKSLLLGRYKENIRLIKKILDGRPSDLVDLIRKKMMCASRELNFEKAAYYRGIVQKLNYISQPINTINAFIDNPNFLEDIRSAELLSLSRILKPLVNINSLARIECYDVAHLMGSAPAASMVTFINGVEEKNLYRRFKIRQTKRNSDIDSLLEIAKRRVKHLSETGWGRPDLVIVDGGKAQLRIFQSVFNTYNIPVIGLAKRFETLIIESSANKYDEIRAYGPALRLAQRLRNEAHRFARAYHHKLVTKILLGKK